MGRAIAALIGMNQDEINQKVYEGAIGEFRQQIPAGGAEEAQERIVGETIQRNADLRARGLIGNDTVAVNDFLITNLSLRSRPEAVMVGGVFEWREAPGQLGADAPEPSAALEARAGRQGQRPRRLAAGQPGRRNLPARRRPLGREPDARDQGSAARHASR